MRTIIVAFIIIASVNAHSHAQDKKTYVAFNYIKAKPGKGGAYTELIKKYSTKILDFAVKTGAFQAWYFYELRLPVGSANEYDYVAVSVVNDFKYILEEPGTYADIMKKAFPGITDKELEDIAGQFEDSRISVKREILVKTSGLVQNAVPSKYARVDYNMTADGMEQEYLKMETELMAPVHKDIIASGSYKDWQLLKRAMPVDQRADYNYIAIDFIDDASTFVALDYSAVAKKVYPGVDLAKFWNTVATSRKIVRSEIWQLVTYVR
jgi:hypothetical protein